MSEWNSFRLQEIAKISAGGDVPKGAFSKHKTPVFGIPVISNGTGDDAIYGYTNIEKISGPCITIAARGTIGYIAFYDRPFYPIIRLICVVPDQKRIIPKFLYYQLRGMRLIGTSSGISQLTIPMVSKYKIRVPDLESQQKIVQILDALKTESDIIERRIKKERKILDGLCQRVIYSSPPNSKLGNVAELVSGYSFKSSSYVEHGKYSIITIANVQDKTISLDGVSHIDRLPKDLQKCQVLEVGDIVVSMTGNVGRVAKVRQKDCLLNQRVGKIMPKTVDGDYLYYMLAFGCFKKYMQHKAQGGAQSNLSNKDISGFPIYLPNAKCQKKMVEYLRRQSSIIDNLEILHNLKHDQYRYLLNHLIAGDFDLSNIKLERKESK